ncbi:MAG: ribosome assembly RNA-binding protein YhbY [Candidatus Riflebacteria bacterium]|nr:ribosome assembly RNA-binding protein YhbY [Candidatus Riflebacteria bacterium]
MPLSSKQRKFLESLAHSLEPVVRIGKFGVTPTLVQTVHENLSTQELIKIKILESAEVDKNEVAEILVEKTNATKIQIIGRIIILYRSNPELKHQIEVPGMEAVAGKPDSGPKKGLPGRKGTAASSNVKKASTRKKTPKTTKKTAAKPRKTVGTLAKKQTTRRSKR